MVSIELNDRDDHQQSDTLAMGASLLSLLQKSSFGWLVWLFKLQCHAVPAQVAPTW